jgi:membrane-bound lytic murein transglycosylase B
MMRKAVIAFLVVVFLFSAFVATRADAVFDCLKLTTTSAQSDKDFCKGELAEIEAQLADLLARQKEQQKHTGTLIGDVNYLTSQINALRTKVKARALAISQLKVDITEKANKIVVLSDKIDREHKSLAQLLRNTNEFDNATVTHLILSDGSISDFYNDLESFASIKQAVRASVDAIRGIKTETEFVKQDLEKKQNAETDAKVELETAQKKVAVSEAEKKKLLNISKQQEEAYGLLAADKKARADRIRAALFPLRDSAAIPFGLALEYAQEAEKATGVRPAFLLAIMTQESNLGANVGTCNRLTDPESKSWQNIMKPERDIEPFKRITTALGISPIGLPLSCPWGSGWGGAMGPAQFIPSTWELMASKVRKSLGISGMPDPWNPKHAFTASATFLGDLGANNRGFTAERESACRYYSGRGCQDPKVKNIFYGNAVMDLATKIQADIDLL